MFDPSTAEGWKSQIALAAKPHLPASPIEGPVQVDIAFFFPRPKSHYHVRKGGMTLREEAPAMHTSKPDLDNLDKAVLDALTTLRMWRDDSQVVATRMIKAYAEEPGAEITISRVNSLTDLMEVGV